MLSLDEGFIASVREKYGQDISKINLSNNGLQDLGSLGQLANLIKLNLSKNNLQHLAALQSLKKVTELNLAENHISKIDDLEPLKNLESLDLRGNRIFSLNDIGVIATLPRLFTIQLAGNAICLSEDYPHGVFQLQDSLQYVDTWTRDEVIRKPTSAPSSNHNASATTTNYVLHSPPPSVTPLEGLEAQCVALREALEIQERGMNPSPSTLSTSYRHTLHTIMKLKRGGSSSNTTTTKVAASSTPNDANEASTTRPVVAVDGIDGGALIHLPSMKVTQPPGSAPANFPYVQLLTRWRESVVKMQIQLQLQSRDLKLQHEDFARFRNNTAQKILQLETTTSSFQLKLKSAQDRETYLTDKLTTLEKDVLRISGREEEGRRQLIDVRNSLSQLRNYLVHFTSSLWPQLQVQVQHQMKTQQERLARCAARVLTCQEHLGFVAHRNSIREIAHRNNVAAWEVEKKMWRQNHHAASMKVLDVGVVKAVKLSGNDVNAAAQQDEQQQQDEEEGIGHLPPPLSAAAESALLSLFRSLPSYEFSGMGCVATFLNLLVDLQSGQIREDEDGDKGRNTSGREGDTSDYYWDMDGSEDDAGLVQDGIILPWSGGKALAYGLRELGGLMRHLLTPFTFSTLVLNLLQLIAKGSDDAKEGALLVYDEGYMMTWGECLSYLLPSSAPPRGVRLSPREYADLGGRGVGKAAAGEERGRGLVYDELASVPPLHLPSLMDLYKKVKKGTSGGLGAVSVGKVLERDLEGMTKKDLIKEVSQLRTERSLLLTQIQELSRQVLERGEGVKKYFVSSLREKDLLLGHVKEQLQIQADAASAKGKEVTELRSSLEELRTSLNQRETDWTERMRGLQAELDKFTSEREREAVKELVDAREKIERLEKECKILRGEKDRGEVRFKSKERDVLSLQNTVSSLREELGKRDKEVGELRKEKDEAKEVIRDREREGDGWRQRVGELEAQVQLLLAQQQQQQQQHSASPVTNPIPTPTPIISATNTTTSVDAIVPAPSTNQSPDHGPIHTTPGQYGSRKEVAGLQLQRLLGMYEKLMMGDE